MLDPQEWRAIAVGDDEAGLLARLHRGASPNETTEPLTTPLSIAAASGALKCIGQLIANGANLNSGYPSPTEAAIKADQLPALEVLLQAGADSGSSLEYDEDYPPPLVVAIEAGSVRGVEMLLAFGALGTNWPAIDAALEAGLELRGKLRYEMLRTLLLGIPDAMGQGVPNSGSLLRVLKTVGSAAKKKKDEPLVEIVANFQRQLKGTKALLGAAEDLFLEHRFEELFALIEEASQEQMGQLLGLIGTYSATGGYYFSEWLLEDHLALPVCDEHSRTALMFAVRSGCQSIARQLIRGANATADCTDDCGLRARHYLGLRPRMRHDDSIEWDLDYLESKEHGRHPTPVADLPQVAVIARDLVRRRQIPELVQLLTSGGLASGEKRLVAGVAVLEDCRNGCFSLLEYCLDNGADLNVANDAGWNVLHDACRAHSVPLQLLTKIVELGGDPLWVDKSGRSVAEVVRSTWPENHECRLFMERVIAERTLGA